MSATYITLDPLASAAGITDHGALTGLLDDDHTQYQLEAAPYNFPTTGVAISANTDGTEMLYGVTNTSISRTITLNALDEVTGRVIIVKDESGGASINNIIVDTGTAALIDGVASISITADYGVLRVYFRNGNWFSF